MKAMPLTSPIATDLLPEAATAAEMAAFAAKAAEAAALLASLGHPARLMVLCHLGEGEMSVGALNRHIPLSQPALSQHLARLRCEGLVETRRSGVTILYRIASPAVGEIIATLRRCFCPAPHQDTQS